ncbi:TIGR02186 family protein [Rhizorhabdus phycosphaerae]|uniref:TIGR02186 family protein n=1 Tax=Rhizorhabdus phycosphaerae TaxID=2711156 RepID=UPI0013E9B6A4|nr:TIGR02186 family protein [Rhizorhabdus phycosphaerae]
MRALLLACLAPVLIAASGPKLVPDVSQRKIEIIYSFTGAELLLFGAILYPGGRTPSDDAQIAVVVKGPSEPVLVREKRKIAGMWINADSSDFRSAPSFYALASSRPIAELVDQRTAVIYELGIDNLQLSPASSGNLADDQRFEEGLIELKRRGGYYSETDRGVEISEGVLYRARIAIPARVPVGRYTAETFLIERGRVVAAATREIEIHKSGMEAFVARAAERHGILYGLTAVLLSLGLGWAASVAFRRLRE